LGVSIHESRKPCEHISNINRELHPILATDVFGFIGVLIRLWRQKVKGQGHSRQRHESQGEYKIFVTTGDNFTTIRSSWHEDMPIGFLGQKFEVTTGAGIIVDGSP